MRVFVASLAIETYTFSPLYVNRSAFESAFYCPPGPHPETPTLCSAPVVAARRRAQADGFTLPHQRDGRGCRCGRRFPGISAHRLPRPSRGSRRFLHSNRLRRGSAHARCIRLPCDRSLHDQPVARRQWWYFPTKGISSLRRRDPDCEGRIAGRTSMGQWGDYGEPGAAVVYLASRGGLHDRERAHPRRRTDSCSRCGRARHNGRGGT